MYWLHHYVIIIISSSSWCHCVLCADIRDTVKYKDVMKEYPLLLFILHYWRISSFVFDKNILTSSSAIAEKLSCTVSKLWQKYKSEKRASNIALSYGDWRWQIIILLFYVTMFVLNAFMQHLGVNCRGNWRFELGFFIWFIWFFCLRNLGWFLKVQWHNSWNHSSRAK